MHNDPLNLILGENLRLDLLGELMEPPKPWEPGEARYWDDPHIATEMLKAHLDPNTRMASAPEAFVDASVAWIMKRLGLTAGDTIIDLGCGPGLYSRRFAERGLGVVGVDLSQNSIDYARAHDPASTYRCMNYLELADEAAYDAAVIIYGDYSALQDADRAKVLANVHRALKPNGWFAFDVPTRVHHQRHNCGNSWSVEPNGGFWKPGPYISLTCHFAYPEQDLAVEQYVIVENDGTISVYRNWYRNFDAGSITSELKEGGFVVRDLYSVLAGIPFDPDGEWIAAVAQKA